MQTHWQCFVYPRCTKSISVHPAARLADRACNRARAYLREYYVAEDKCNEKFDRKEKRYEKAWLNKIHDDLKDSMFYI